MCIWLKIQKKSMKSSPRSDELSTAGRTWVGGDHESVGWKDQAHGEIPVAHDPHAPSIFDYINGFFHSQPAPGADQGSDIFDDSVHDIESKIAPTDSKEAAAAVESEANTLQNTERHMYHIFEVR